METFCCNQVFMKGMNKNEMTSNYPRCISKDLVKEKLFSD